MRLILSAVAVALAATPAAAYLTQNDQIVRDLGGGRFEVTARAGLSGPDAWCAAGDYAIRFLGLPMATRIWRISEPPRPQGAGVVFSLSSEGAASRTGLAMLGRDDGSLPAVHAQALCDDRAIRD